MRPRDRVGIGNRSDCGNPRQINGLMSHPRHMTNRNILPLPGLRLAQTRRGLSHTNVLPANDLDGCAASPRKSFIGRWHALCKVGPSNSRRWTAKELPSFGC